MNALLLFVAMWIGTTVVEARPLKTHTQTHTQFRQSGVASWYGSESSRTASGKHYNPNALTAAHRSLPFGTLVEVLNKANGRSVTVRINDRGPYCKKRIIDVSKAAAQQLEMIGSGTAKVELLVVR